MKETSELKSIVSNRITLPSAEPLTEPVIWSEEKAGGNVERVPLYNLFIDLISEDHQMIWNSYEVLDSAQATSRTNLV